VLTTQDSHTGHRLERREKLDDEAPKLQLDARRLLPLGERQRGEWQRRRADNHRLRFRCKLDPLPNLVQSGSHERHHIVVDRSTPTSELAISKPRIEVAPFQNDADRIELADLRTPQRSQQIAKVARIDLDRPIAGWRTQVCREVCLQMERREAATQQQPKRLAVTGPASFGELNGVEKFQWTLPETNAALNSETVDGMSPEVAAKTCSMSEYRRSMASVVLNVGLPPGISSDECNMNSI